MHIQILKAYAACMPPPSAMFHCKIRHVGFENRSPALDFLNQFSVSTWFLRVIGNAKSAMSALKTEVLRTGSGSSRLRSVPGYCTPSTLRFQQHPPSRRAQKAAIIKTCEECARGAADVARGCDVHQEAWTRFGCLHAHRGSWRDSSTEGSSGWPLLPMSSHPSHVSCLELHQMLKLVRPPNLDTIIIRFVAHGEPNRSFKWLPCQAGRNASRSRERIW